MLFNKTTLLVIFSLIYMGSLCAIYLSKERIKNKENAIYSGMMSVNIFGLMLQLILEIITRNVSILPPLFVSIILKVYLIHFIIYLSLIIKYLITISFDKHVKPLYNINYIFLGIISIILLILPTNLYFNPVTLDAYSYGLGNDFAFFISAVIDIILIFIIILRRKKISKKKVIPLCIFIIVGVICGNIQQNYPSITLMGCAEAFICFLMYFTIENPDVKMIEQLNILKEQADKANNAKTEFLSSMSHEIRTPLNAIVGFSNSLSENKNLPKELQDEVKDIVTASDNLLEIVNGVLDISKIEANKIEIIKKEYDTRKMFDELCKLTKVRIGEKPIEFISKIDEDLPKVLYGDSTRVKQVILNLLTNAAKYTDEGKIEFDVKSVKKDNTVKLIISVSDTGKGIKEKDVAKLFNKFERLEEEDSTIEGTGLGLAITKKLLDLMHGTITVDSTYGKGSKFTISLDQGYVEKPSIKFEDTNMIISSLDLTGKRILLVDDNKLNIKVAMKLLEVYKAEITTLLSGEELLELLKKDKKFDIILLDDMMPKMSGTEAFNKIKEDNLYEGPIVALTANALTGEKEKYLEIGFDDYLAKPIEKIELNRVLKKYLKK